jgi:hypothetical protein
MYLRALDLHTELKQEMLHEFKLFLQDLNYDFKQSMTNQTNLVIKKTKYTSELNNTILEGELILHENKYIFMGFDCLFFNGKDLRNETVLTNRLKNDDDSFSSSGRPCSNYRSLALQLTRDKQLCLFSLKHFLNNFTKLYTTLHNFTQLYNTLRNFTTKLQQLYKTVQNSTQLYTT